MPRVLTSTSSFHSVGRFNPQGNVLPFAQAFKCEALTLEELAERIAKDDHIKPSDNKPPGASPTPVESVDGTAPEDI